MTRDRRFVRLLALLLVIAVGLGVYSAFQTNRAQQQAQLATSRSLAAQAERLAGRQSDLAQLLSLESLHTDPIPEAWASIQTTLSGPLHPSHQLTGHTNWVIGVAFSPDGKLLATTSDDRSIRLWDVASHQPLGQPLTDHTNAVYGWRASHPSPTLFSGQSPCPRWGRRAGVTMHQQHHQPQGHLFSGQDTMCAECRRSGWSDYYVEGRDIPSSAP